MDKLPTADEIRDKYVNRYSRIHILFRELAKAKGVPDKVLSAETLSVKKFWKDFMGVDSLTTLSDKQLVEMEFLIQTRIKSLKQN